VPAEQISLMLGHLVSDSRDVTEIYAPYDPDYCVDAVAALDVYVRRVLALAAAPVSPGYHPNALLGPLTTGDHNLVTNTRYHQTKLRWRYH